jgi:hypothetical protein
LKTKGIIGGRIVAIRQVLRREPRGHHMNVYEIEMDNGCILRPVVGEMENDYVVDFVVVKPQQLRTALEGLGK